MEINGSVLIADDDEVFRDCTARLLRGDGLRCDCVEDGTQAMRRLAQSHYDVLIADIRMPGNEEGLALVRDASRIAPSLPVILVTGYPSLDTAVSSIQLAVMAYLQKPVEYATIRDHVRRTAEQSALRRTIVGIQQRLASSSEALAHLQSDSDAKQGQATAASTTLVRDLAAALSDILRVRAELGHEEGTKSLCSLLNCRILPSLQDAILDAINTLKRTKSSFKSKELADLRLRLEAILEKPHHSSHPHISCATFDQRRA